MEFASKDDLRRHVTEAFRRGRAIDLDHCVYGPATGGRRGYINETLPYYRLLAGHVLHTGARVVLEIGTHYGGSTLAMLEGMRALRRNEELRIVTVDVTSLNQERLGEEVEIRRLIGDARSPDVTSSIRALLPTSAVDLLYIDALKEPAFLVQVIGNLHAAGVTANWIILDDALANSAMQGFWQAIEARMPELSLQVAQEFPHIRDPKTGFGVIRVPDMDALMRELHGTATDLEIGPFRFGAERKNLAEVYGASVARRAKGAARLAAPRGGSTDRELNLLFHVARDCYRGDGDIVETGAFLGATTRALCEGLDKNPDLPFKVGRLTAYDHFVHDKPTLEKHVRGRVAPNASLLPIFCQTLDGYLEKVNVVDMPLNTARWCGRPIELLVLGSQRNPQTLAALIREFAPFFSVGGTILISRDFKRPHRPWSCFGLLSLMDHLDLLEVSGPVGVFAVKSAIVPWKIARLTQNDWPAEERIHLIERFAIDRITDPRTAMEFISIAAGIAAAEALPGATRRLLDRAGSMAGGDQDLAGLAQSMEERLLSAG